MDLDRMLAKCRAGQWRPDDLDWTVAPRPLPRETEIAVVQYFTDMAAIERLAKALFAEQGRRASDPRLRAIFATFVADEERHAVVAERLARFYDRHGLRDYRVNPHLAAFRGPFLDLIRLVPAELANVYITTGELILDIALLRSLTDFVGDAMCAQAMRRINRDESRHIAIDYYMAEYYASDGYQAWLRAQPRRPIGEVFGAWRAFALVLVRAAPFIRDVFFAPMRMTDPSGRRMREAFRRVQMLGHKPGVTDKPFTRFMRTLQRAYDVPAIRRVCGPVLERVAGVPGEVLSDLLTDDEKRRAARTSFDDLAREALAVKATPEPGAVYGSRTPERAAS